ncbi:hypothetical protein BD413DRAFT_97815 [Trametes elegans]|nr:hypothetical protein BD413DRAFT_97815 [Trametes elegans]
MAVPFDRETLKHMKRAELQRVCKDFGIKANLKTEALIDLLIDTTQARPRHNPPAPARRAPSGRIASRSVGTRLRGSSSSSVIIHDTDEEDNAADQVQRSSIAPRFSESEAPPPPPPPRTRRAKETQYRLGVGRPTLVGGTGARAVTRSTGSTAKGRRGKSSKSAKPKEAAIQEEEEPDPMAPAMPEAGPSGTIHDHEPQQLQAFPIPEPPRGQPTTALSATPDVPDNIKTYLTNLIGPLQAQIQLLQSELQQRASQAADVQALTAQVQLLQVEMQSLRPQAAMTVQLQTEVQQLKLLVSGLSQQSLSNAPVQSAKSLGKARASDDTSTTVAVSEPSHGVAESTPPVAAFPGLAQSLLGKRARDANDSQMTDTVEAGQEERYSQEDLDKRVVRPTKKRLKLSEEAQQPAQSSSSTNAHAAEEAQDSNEVQAVQRPPATFTVFRGPEELEDPYVDPPPPTTHLSDLLPDVGQTPYMMHGGGAIPRPAGSDENAHQQLAFNFSFNSSIFQPMTSTPFEMGPSGFPFLEPPASPTPNVPNGGFVHRAGRIERNDLYQPHGRRQAEAQAQDQAQSRPQSAAERPASSAGQSQAQAQLGSNSGGTIDPSSLMNTSTPQSSQEANSSLSHGLGFGGQGRRVPSSTEIGYSLGMSSSVPLPPDTPAQPTKRTMYGTELESDTRFGDFGVEGVATGFWAGLVQRF